jgi:arylsulfatase A-like enzyme
LITLDTTRVDHIGAYGHAAETTPNLDRLAAGGVQFERAWTTSPWTLPAHASMFTGRYPSRHGADYSDSSGQIGLADVIAGVDDRLQVNALPESAITLAELLSTRGYATGAFVAGPWLEPLFGLLQGYATQDAGVSHRTGRSATEITDAAIAWVRGIPRERPLHLMANYFDPHAPYSPPEAFTAPTEAKRPPARMRYAGELRYMDAEIGRLFDKLREVGRFDQALIVVVADHGELFGEHGLRRHGFYLYEELVRVPLIVRYPLNRRAGEREGSVVSVVDLLPMIAAEIGFDVPASVDGLPVGERRVALAEFHRNPSVATARGQRVDRDLIAAIDWPWKLIRSGDGTEELYRIDEDPGEQTSLSGVSEAAEAERAMQERIDEAVAAFEREPSSANPAVAPPELRESLRALGYIE